MLYLINAFVFSFEESSSYKKSVYIGNTIKVSHIFIRINKRISEVFIFLY